MLLHVSLFSPPTSRPYSPLVSVGSGLGLAPPGISASPSQSSAAGGSREVLRDFRIDLGVTSTKNALQSNNARPGLYNSSVALSTVQTLYQGFKVLPFTRFDHEGRYGGLTSGDESWQSELDEVI